MLTISPCYDITVRDLQRLRKEGHCVYRSSHAGNWSLYKLLLSEAGLPDCIWDATCIHRDVNNQPRCQIIAGRKIPLLGEDAPISKVDSKKYLTAYHWTKPGEETLARFHLAPLQKMYGDLITSQSRELMKFKSNLQKVFEIVEKHEPRLLGRYILPCGCMVNMVSQQGALVAECAHSGARLDHKDLAESAIGTLAEMERLFFDPKGYVPKGGAFYTFELVVACYYLWAYWRFGGRAVYELSGPDMLGYATKQDFVKKIENVLLLLRKHLPDLVPHRVDAKIVPATAFRFGYPEGNDQAKAVMIAHDKILRIQGVKREHLEVRRKELLECAPELQSLQCVINDKVDDIHRACDRVLSPLLATIKCFGRSWDLFHNPSRDAFFSQHDLAQSGKKMEILEGYLDVPFSILSRIMECHKSRIDKLTRAIIPERQLVDRGLGVLPHSR